MYVRTQEGEGSQSVQVLAVLYRGVNKTVPIIAQRWHDFQRSISGADQKQDRPALGLAQGCQEIATQEMIFLYYSD